MTVKHVFLGKRDPSRVTLEKVIPGTSVTFSTPFEELTPRQRVVIEGDQTHLERLAAHLETIHRAAIEERYFSSWSGIGPNEHLRAWQLFYNAHDKPVNSFRLLVLVLREHLVKICDLKLTQVSHLIATLEGVVVADQPVPLPEEIGNGVIELPVIIAPSN